MITDLEKRLRLRDLGYNPDEIEEFNPEAEQAPVSQQNPTPTTPKEQTTSATGALLRSGARGLPSAAAGVASAAGGAKLGAAIGLPFGGPIGSAVGAGIGAVGGGLLGGFGTRLLQDKVVIPTLGENIQKAYEQSEAIDRAEHPVASTVGEIASSLPFLRPSLKAFPGAGRAIANPLRGVTPDVRDIGNLAEVGLGAAIPVGARVATDPNVTAPELIAEAIGGSVLNRPTSIGQALGLSPQVIRELPITAAKAQAAQRTGNTLPVKEQLLFPERIGAIEVPDTTKSVLEYPKSLTEIEQQLNEAPPRVDALDPVTVDETAKLQAEHAQAQEALATEKARIEAETAKAKAETERLKAIQSELKPATVEEFPDYTKGVVDDAFARDQEAATKTSDLNTQRLQPINAGLTKQGISPNPTVETADLYKKLGEERNVNIKTDKKVFASDGREVAGQSDIRVGEQPVENRINPTKAGLDTMPHELTHNFDDDLEVLGSAKAKAFIKRADRVFADSPVYKEWKAARDAEGRDSSVKEFRATLTGEDAVRRLYSTDNKGDIRNWFDDVRSAFKVRRGKGDTSDVSRVMSAKLLYDAPFDQTFKSSTPKVQATTGERNSEGQEAKPVNVTPKGVFDTGMEGFPNFHFYDLQEDIPGHPKGSTVSQKTLVEKGYKIPDGIAKDDDATYKAKIEQLAAFKKTRTSEEPSIPRNAEVKETTTNITPKSAPRQRLAQLIPSEIDLIRKIGAEKATHAIGTAKANEVADGMTDFYDKFAFHRGKLVNSFANRVKSLVDLDGIVKPLLKSPKNYIAQDTPELRSTWQKMRALRAGDTTVKFSPTEEKIRAEIRSSLDQVRKMHRERPVINHQPGEDNPNYVPDVIDNRVLSRILENRDSAEAKKLQEEFVKFQTNEMVKRGKPVDPAKAETKARENLETLLTGYNKQTADIASQYGPIDKAEGFGLPDSWREQNPLRAMERYLDRVARRFAYADAIEAKGESFQNALKAVAGNKHVITVMNDIKGARPIDENKRNALMGLVSSSNMGPLTGARDFTANLTLGFQHHSNPIQAVVNGIKALGNLKENLADAFETGRIRQHISDLEWGDMVGGLRRIRDVITDVQGRNFLEQITRATAMGQGKLTTLDFHEQHRNGTLGTQGKKWFEDFGKDVDWKKQSLTRDDLLTIAARYVDSVQGGYDYRGLPKIAVEGSWSPLLKLARWNIEKANNYQKHVVQPLLDGNPTPFLMSTLGMFLGGAAITELTEVVSGRKDKLPTLKEIKTSREMGNDVLMPATYKALGLASAAGYAGIVGDTVKGIVDRIYGKNKPRWYNNMLLEFGSSVGTTFFNGVSAVADEGITPDLAFTMASDIIEDNLQSYRLILARVSEDVAPMGNKEQIEKSNKMRDLRVYKTLAGEEVSDFVSSEFAEDYTRKDLKRFKNEENLSDAAAMLPELVNKAIENADGDMEQLKKELSRIRRNSYQTMPNPETMPKSFTNYLKFLEKRDGRDAMQERLMDYLLQNAKNQAKSSMVP